MAVRDQAKFAHRYVGLGADPAWVIDWLYADAAYAAFDNAALRTGQLGGEAQSEMFRRIAAQSARQLDQRLWAHFPAGMTDLSKLDRLGHDAKEGRPRAVLRFDAPTEIAGKTCGSCAYALRSEIKAGTHGKVET